MIDIRPFREGTAEHKLQVARQVSSALEDIGFMAITGHQVPLEVIDRMYDVSRRFYDLPEEEKLRDAELIGYRRMLSLSLARTLDKEAPADLREAFAHSSGKGWPERPPELAQIWTEYQGRMLSLELELTRICALALDLPEDYFHDKFDQDSSTLSVINYPDISGDILPGQLRSGEHTDYGILSILAIDSAPGGLQVRTRRGDWVDVRPIPGSFIINVGDSLMRWTNNRWLSNLHRVAIPPRDVNGSTRRQTIVYFQNCKPDVMLTCIESCASPENPPKYEPIRVQDYLEMKQRKSKVY